MRDESLDVRRQVEPGRLAFLGRDIAHEDAWRRGAQDGVPDGRDQETRQKARVQAARTEHDEIRLRDRHERILRRLDGLRRDPDTIDARGAHDLRLPIDDGAVRQAGMQREGRR